MDSINFIRDYPRQTSSLDRQKIFSLFGIWLLLFSISSIVIAFLPLAQKEINYRLNNLPSITLPRISLPKQTIKKVVDKPVNSLVIKPVNTDFGIVIPKIEVNSTVTPNVDLNDEIQAEPILEKSVAHALGSSFPGQKGTIFLYGHSSFLDVLGNGQNSVFYLLEKLEKGDEVDLFFNNYRYLYKVTDTKVTEPEDISFLVSGKEQLVLQTCWPLGTTLKRFVVIAQPIKDVI
jgi:sortase A